MATYGGVHTAGCREDPIIYCRLTDEPLSVDEIAPSAISGPGGGTVIFVGTVRNNNSSHESDKLYLAYPAMVHRTLMDIIEE